MDITSIIGIAGLVLVEISVLVYLYRNYITGWNVSKWQERAEETGFLSDLLADPIVEVAEMVSASIIEQLKQEYLASQGTLTRVSKASGDNPMAMGLEVSEGILKSMGWKNPNVLMVAKLAQTLGGLISNDSEPKKGQSLPVGKDLFGPK